MDKNDETQKSQGDKSFLDDLPDRIAKLKDDHTDNLTAQRIEQLSQEVKAQAQNMSRAASNPSTGSKDAGSKDAGSKDAGVKDAFPQGARQTSPKP